MKSGKKRCTQRLDGASVDHDPAFGEPLRHIGVTQAVAGVPPDGKSDDLIGEAVT